MRGNQIGEIFKDKREELKLTIEQVYLVTRIPKEDILLMEQGKLASMPVNFFTYSKLLRYSKHLNLDSNVISALYRREVVGVNKQEIVTTPTKRLQSFYNQTIQKIPKQYILGFVLIIFVIAGVFINPIIKALSPAELVITVPAQVSAGETANYVASGNSISFEGKTSANARLLVNKREIDLEPGGNFITPEIPLPNATELIEIVAINPLGISSQVSFNITKRTVSQALEVNAQILVTAQSNLKIIVDGKEVLNQNYFPSDAIAVKAFTSLQIESDTPNSYSVQAGSVNYPFIANISTWQVLAGRLIAQP